MMGKPAWLSKNAGIVYDATLPEIDSEDPEKLEMLAAYADAMVNLRRYRHDRPKAKVWRQAMIYARNGLGIGQKVFVDLLDILLNWNGGIDEPDPIEHLKKEWQLPESERPDNYSEST